MSEAKAVKVIRYASVGVETTTTIRICAMVNFDGEGHPTIGDVAVFDEVNCRVHVDGPASVISRNDALHDAVIAAARGALENDR